MANSKKKEKQLRKRKVRIFMRKYEQHCVVPLFYDNMRVNLINKHKCDAHTFGTYSVFRF